MYKVHSFTQVGINTFTISSVIANPSFQYLIVAGGGNGGHSDGSVQAQRMSGGGAGGVVQIYIRAITLKIICITWTTKQTSKI